MLTKQSESTSNTQHQGEQIISVVYRNDGPNGEYLIPGTLQRIFLYNGETIAVDKKVELR